MMRADALSRSWSSHVWGDASMLRPSVDQLIGVLRCVGIDIVKGPVERRDGASVFVHDPDGVHVELRVDGVLT